MDERPPRGEAMVPAVGLCSVCRHAKVVENRRGSRFYLCGLAARDPAFPRYPPLPVTHCEGFRPLVSPDPEGTD
jgi:hypothetical protein